VAERHEPGESHLVSGSTRATVFRMAGEYRCWLSIGAVTVGTIPPFLRVTLDGRSETRGNAQRETMNSFAASETAIVLNQVGVWRDVSVPTQERVEAGRRTVRRPWPRAGEWDPR
jgi:hypothetical protein